MATVMFDVADTFAARRDLAALGHSFQEHDGSLHIEFEGVSEEDAMFLMIKASTSHGFQAKDTPGSMKAEPIIAPHLRLRAANMRVEKADERVAKTKDGDDAPASRVAPKKGA